MADTVDELTRLLGSIVALHCPKGHSHTEKKPFEVLYQALAHYQVSDVFGLDVTPRAEDLTAFDEVTFLKENGPQLKCGTCHEVFPVPEKGKVIWP